MEHQTLNVCSKETSKLNTTKQRRMWQQFHPQTSCFSLFSFFRWFLSLTKLIPFFVNCHLSRKTKSWSWDRHSLYYFASVSCVMTRIMFYEERSVRISLISWWEEVTTLRKWRKSKRRRRYHDLDAYKKFKSVFWMKKAKQGIRIEGEDYHHDLCCWCHWCDVLFALHVMRENHLLVMIATCKGDTNHRHHHHHEPWSQRDDDRDFSVYFLFSVCLCCCLFSQQDSKQERHSFSFSLVLFNILKITQIHWMLPESHECLFYLLTSQMRGWYVWWFSQVDCCWLKWIPNLPLRLFGYIRSVFSASLSLAFIYFRCDDDYSACVLCVRGFPYYSWFSSPSWESCLSFISVSTFALTSSLTSHSLIVFWRVIKKKGANLYLHERWLCEISWAKESR